MESENTLARLYPEDFSTLSWGKKSEVRIVCVGDSITGWNCDDMRGLRETPLTYPFFLQKLTSDKVFNGGFSGEYSSHGIIRISDYLALFPESEFFVVGYGSNDLGTLKDLSEVTDSLIRNLEKMRNEIQKNKKKLVFLNVPYMNSHSLSQEIVDECNRKRNFCNDRLRKYCLEKKVALADICSVLKKEHFFDSIHPNEQGARIIANAVYGQLVVI